MWVQSLWVQNYRIIHASVSGISSPPHCRWTWPCTARAPGSRWRGEAPSSWGGGKGHVWGRRTMWWEQRVKPRAGAERTTKKEDSSTSNHHNRQHRQDPARHLSSSILHPIIAILYFITILSLLPSCIIVVIFELQVLVVFLSCILLFYYVFWFNNVL